MDKTSQFSLANRKQLADLLTDKYEGLRYKAKQNFRRKRDELRDALIEEYAEKKGATPAVKQIEAAQRKIHELTSELSQLGFEVCGSGLRLCDEYRNPLENTIRERLKKDIGTEDDIDARFDSAQLAMMTVATLEDAEKLLKSVSEV